MPILLVDDRDGRVIAELGSQDEVARVLEGLAKDDPAADHLCVVVFDDRQGSMLGTESSVTVRPWR